MEIEFTLTRADYAEFLKHTYARLLRLGKGNVKFTVINLIVWILIGIGLTGVLRFYETYNGLDFIHLNIGLSFLAIGLICLFAITIYQRKFYMRYSLSESGYLLRKQKAIFNEVVVEVSNDVGQQTYTWKAFQGLEYSKNLVYLFIDNGQAVIFPRNLIEENEALKNLLDTKILSAT